MTGYPWSYQTKRDATFSWWLPPHKKYKILMDSFHRYWWSNNSANWLNEKVFWPTTCEPEFSWYSFCRTCCTISVFILNKLQPNLMTQIFGPFLVIFAQRGFSKKNLAVTHNPIWAPKQHVEFQKKLIMTQFQENLQTDNRTEGRTDPNSIGPFLPQPGVQ